MDLRIGISPCPNDTVQFEALYEKQIDMAPHTLHFDFQDVETLNKAAATEQYDIIKISYARYFAVSNKYILFRAGSALGFGVGPLLITRTAMSREAIMNGRVALPGKETTAHFLFNRAYPNHPNKYFIPFDEIEGAVQTGLADAGVIIHENRFTYASRGLHKIVDLGAYWETETGLPIPLGGIAIRRALPIEVQQQMAQALNQSVAKAFEPKPDGLSHFVQTHAQEMGPDIMQQHIDLYVNEESRAISEKGIQAIRAMGHFLGAEERLPWWL